MFKKNIILIASFKSEIFTAHLAAMEGHLPCLKYLLSNALNANSLISARNDQGDTPKTLAQQFFKDQVVEYLEAVEWDRDHPEQAESKLN